MALADDLATAATDLATVKAVLDTAVADLAATTPVATPADGVLSSVVSALEAAGYTVTPPATVIPVTDGSTPPLEG